MVRKRFSRHRLQGRGLGHTVNDGTNDLVNLSDRASIGAGITSRQSRESIGSERLESAAGDGGWPSVGSPPEGPGETAKRRKKQSVQLETAEKKRWVEH